MVYEYVWARIMAYKSVLYTSYTVLNNWAKTALSSPDHSAIGNLHLCFANI